MQKEIKFFTPVTKAYDKCLKVIDSCENEIHLNATRKYINGFFRTFASAKEENKQRIVFSADELIAAKYLDLKRALDNKKKLLNL